MLEFLTLSTTHPLVHSVFGIQLVLYKYVKQMEDEFCVHLT